jgi:hypothetical protein
MGINAQNAFSDIARERSSWDQGGYRYASKNIQDSYNLDMAKLGQSSYEWQNSQLNDPWNQAITYTGNIASGATTGFNTGMSIFNFLGYTGAFGGGGSASAGGSAAAVAPTTPAASGYTGGGYMNKLGGNFDPYVGWMLNI